jgi:hypothetical protein
MINIAQAVQDELMHDDIALAAARQGWLNLSAYARSIRPQVEEMLMKDAQEGSIVTALSRIMGNLPGRDFRPAPGATQGLSVHSNLEGITYERSLEVSNRIREIYSRVSTDHKTYLTITQGINEITIIAEARVAQMFREKLTSAHKIYDKQNLVGITVRFELGNLEIPNLIFDRTRRLAYKDINIIEIVSTATELTYMIEKKDLPVALEQLQKDI